MSTRSDRVPVPESAAHLMTRQCASARVGERVAALRERLAREKLEIVDPVCVVDEEDRFVTALPLAALVSAPAELEVSALPGLPWPHVLPDTDQEHVAALARQHRVFALPVVDRDGRWLGSVSALTLLDVVWAEHVEDLHRLAGVVHATESARDALEGAPVQRFRRRLPWLLVGLGGSVLATGIVVRFEAALASKLSIAFFVPGIVYLADAIGTQTEAAAVRGLSLCHRPLRELVAGEVLTGALIGLVLGIAAFILIGLLMADLWLGLGVAIALLGAGTIASTIGLVLPWLLSRVGGDPAFGAGPVATVIQDILSLLIYFMVMSLLFPA